MDIRLPLSASTIVSIDTGVDASGVINGPSLVAVVEVALDVGAWEEGAVDAGVSVVEEIVAVVVDPLNDEEILEVEMGSVNTTGL